MDSILKQISTLNPKELYHFQLSSSATTEEVQGVARLIGEHGLRGLITREGLVIETLKELVNKLPPEKKDELFAILSDRPKFTIDEPQSRRKLVLDWGDEAVPENAVNPLDHEQTK